VDPAILDVLKANGIKASFFLVGMRIEEEPGLVARIAAEGHEIGVHTYSHPNLAEISEDRTVLELNATQRLIEDVTGRSTILFRPPYNADSRPQEMPRSWQSSGTGAGLSDREQRHRHSGLGQAGGREDLGSSEAVPRRRKRHPHARRRRRSAADPGSPARDHLLPEERGDRFVPLGQLIGQPSEQLMPPVPGTSSPLPGSSPRGVEVAPGRGGVPVVLHDLGDDLGPRAHRIIVVLAARHHRRHRTAEEADTFQPPVSVLLPAYNEEKGHRRTLRALLDTDYAGALEVLVVDNGSADRTAEIVSEIAGEDRELNSCGRPSEGKPTRSALAWRRRATRWW